MADCDNLDLKIGVNDSKTPTSTNKFPEKLAVEFIAALVFSSKAEKAKLDCRSKSAFLKNIANKDESLEAALQSFNIPDQTIKEMKSLIKQKQHELFLLSMEAQGVNVVDFCGHNTNTTNYEVAH